MTDKTPFITLEDLTAGQKFTAGPQKVTQEEIIAFARQFDPQDFHTDPVKAKDTVFGELVASGWHTAALAMRMIVEATPKMQGGMVGRAVENISWPRPVRPGDLLSLTVEITDLRPSEKSPARGLMRTKNTVTNQNGETVMEMEAVVFVPRRSV
ncbi:MAG: MaoC family dehydratase [Alphaproteobacteria bacterium]|nr:MaoC family dehydratase [Alphaproteobacteria bacterium]